jgi:2-dehydropantoate 2-reductase
MRHAILGAGGVGGLVGGALARAGHPVTLLVRPGRAEQYPERLSVQSRALGSFEAPVEVAERLGEPPDVVWITVKATALEAALDAVPPEELGDQVVVPLLNGIDHVELLRGRYGAERVLPWTIRVEAERAGPGEITHLSAFADAQVAPGSATRARAEALCEELRVAGLGCEVRDDEVTMLWSKLCFLAPFALATTAAGGALGVVRSDPRWWTRLQACVEEACAVGLAEGAEVAPEPIRAMFGGLPEGFRSSMQKDAAAGRPPELDAIAGPILRGGEEHGIDLPATRFFVERIAVPE